MLEIGKSELWLEKLQPLLGSLSVAMPSVSISVLSDWLGRPEGEVATLLNEVIQIVESDPFFDSGFRLYHRSIADFLATFTYLENGTITPI